jgi:adenylate kinases
MIRLVYPLTSSRRHVPAIVSNTFLTSAVRSISSNPIVFKSASVDDADLVENDVISQFMLILGKPGGGKGTISKKILKDFPMFTHFSTGDLLRQHVLQKTEIGKEAKKHMDSGSLVPDDLMIRLVLDEAEKEAENGNSLLLDGFPRTMEQAKALAESVNVDLVVDLNVPNDTIIERISERYVHLGSGRVYNLSYNPPRVPGLDDVTGEKLVQREDDKPETVRRRLEAYDKVRIIYYFLF